MIKTRNHNQYYLTSTNLWVRKPTMIGEDINYLISPSEYDLILANEMRNATMNIANIDVETVYTPNVVIISDGYDFDKKQELLKGLKATIIGTNRSLAKWRKLTRMDWYVANNPYKECMSYLPKDYYPRCVVSVRTCPDFIVKYRTRRGVVYRYSPTPDERFRSSYFSTPQYYVDDYRNPICAAISLAYRWQARKILLFCCDDVFAGERSGAEKLQNDLWMYPQHRVSHGLIDAMAYWLKQDEVEICDYSAGLNYEHISAVQNVHEFFDE